MIRRGDIRRIGTEIVRIICVVDDHLILARSEYGRVFRANPNRLAVVRNQIEFNEGTKIPFNDQLGVPISATNDLFKNQLGLTSKSADKLLSFYRLVYLEQQNETMDSNRRASNEGRSGDQEEIVCPKAIRQAFNG